MPRQARIDPPFAVEHVMMRGVDKCIIFHDDEDYEDFLGRARTVFYEHDARVMAFALMPNHLHLLLQTGRTGMAAAMHRVGGGYALRFNQRHDRVGHLFQDRYNSVMVECPAHLRELFRYIPLNPVRAGLVPNVDALGGFPWTSYAETMGIVPPGLVDTRLALAHFNSDSEDRARALMREWVMVGVHEDPGEVIELPTTLAARFSAVSLSRDDRTPHQPPSQAELEALLTELCRKYDVEEHWLQTARRSRDATTVRTEFVVQAWERFQCTQTLLARFLGTSRTTVSNALASWRLNSV